MRSLIFSLFCVILFLPVIPSASAQAQLPPPNYSLTCNSAELIIDVNPETSQPPIDTIVCRIGNQESYAIEFALRSSGDPLLQTSLSVDEITVGGNQEEIFQLSVEAEDGMLMADFNIVITSEVTKTGELDYSDDEPKELNAMARILQYAAFEFTPHQSERQYNLAGVESIELGYSLTSLGNAQDFLSIGLYSVTSRVCEVGRASGDGRTFGECDGGSYAVPISDDCNEKLDIKTQGVNRGMAAPGETLNFYFTISAKIDNSSCWPVDSIGTKSLGFDMTLYARSQFDSRHQGDGSQVKIEYSVDVTIEGDKSLIDKVTPGFESINLVLCLVIAIYVFSRRD